MYMLGSGVDGECRGTVEKIERKESVKGTRVQQGLRGIYLVLYIYFVKVVMF